MTSIVCDLFGIKYPLFQGGMALISDAALAGAVSNAGGLGIIATGNLPADNVRSEIRKAKLLTQKPFAVNVMLVSPYADDIAAVVIEEGVQIVTTGAGLPTKYMKAWLQAGIKVVPVVPSVAVAKTVERAGAVSVIAEGCESGGHIGELSTLALVPQICDAVKIPVIAAGGIADGRAVAAVFMLGAVGVQLGTRFLVAKECNVSQEYKNKILKAKDISTMATGRRLGHPIRAIKNAFTREFLKKEYDNTVSDSQLEAFGTGALRRAAVDGDSSGGCFMAGQICSMVTKEETCEEIITGLFTHTKAVLTESGRWVK